MTSFTHPLSLRAAAYALLASLSATAIAGCAADVEQPNRGGVDPQAPASMGSPWLPTAGGDPGPTPVQSPADPGGLLEPQSPGDPAPASNPTQPLAPDPQFPAAKSHDADLVFWDAFGRHARQEAPMVQAALQSAIDQDPQSGYLRRLLGVSHFWVFAEESTTAPFWELPGRAANTTTKLEEAKSADPSDPWTPCFLGLTKYFLAQTIGDEVGMKAGLDEIERGIELYPLFNTYCRMIAYQRHPKDHPKYQLALDDTFWIMELCEDRQVDRQNPVSTNLAGWDHCATRARVPHVFNGFHLNAGDTFTKAGQIEVARVFYENAKLQHFEDWPYKDLIDERLATIEERAALWADANPANDPQPSLGSTYTCGACHQH